MNPLIEKYEEIYGEKKEEVVEEKTGMARLKEVVGKAQSSVRWVTIQSVWVVMAVRVLSVLLTLAMIIFLSQLVTP